MANVNLCFNVNPCLQTQELSIAIIMALVIMTSQTDSWRSVGVIQGSKMMAMSFAENAKIQCLLIQTVSRDTG
jgi:hypothetical protein